ncbi:hypothetical protein RND81_05G152200 [Saponaria officinalis]|uniref:Uncharacterized protein n=1 Tax=Saponaria officinalis TaxID=3572 RepID=A0AAW1KXV4_SAPOF
MYVAKTRKYLGMILLIFIINCAIIRQAEGDGQAKYVFCYWKCLFAKHQGDCIDRCMGDAKDGEWNTCELNCVNSACSPLAKQGYQGYAKFEECAISCRSRCKKTL